jgi:hypothetical protein
MGNYCNHEKTKYIRDIETDSGILFTDKLIEEQCLSCGNLIRKKITIGKITGRAYGSSEFIDKKTCKHDRFTVDEKTLENHTNYADTYMQALTFGSKSGYSIAEANCAVCDARFYVQRNYGNKWEISRTEKNGPVKYITESTTNKDTNPILTSKIETNYKATSRLESDNVEFFRKAFETQFTGNYDKVVNEKSKSDMKTQTHYKGNTKPESDNVQVVDEKPRTNHNSAKIETNSTTLDEIFKCFEVGGTTPKEFSMVLRTCVSKSEKELNDLFGYVSKEYTNKYGASLLHFGVYYKAMAFLDKVLGPGNFDETIKFGSIDEEYDALDLAYKLEYKREQDILLDMFPTYKCK